MAAQTQGIQQLLAAEKCAAEKVSDARRRKNRRLKQAKEEAQQEIEKYKAEREKQFRDHYILSWVQVVLNTLLLSIMQLRGNTVNLRSMIGSKQN